MHIGGAVNGLQHVVYDPPAVTVAPVPSQHEDPVVAKDDAADSGDNANAAFDRGYNPVTDLIERLASRSAVPPDGSHGSVFDQSAPPDPLIDMQA